MVRAAISLLFLVGLLTAQAERVVTCRACTNHGSQPCKKHGRDPVLETAAGGTVFCSEAGACKSCGGALAVDCKRCVNPAVEAALERRRQLVADWDGKRRREVDQITDNKPLMHLQTPHCELVFSIRPLMIGRKKVSTHALMHIYGARLESLRKLFRDTLALTDTDLPGTLQIYMFRDQQDLQKIGPRVTGIGTSGAAGTKLMGVPCIYCLWQDSRVMPGDEELHRTLVHNVTHLLLSNMVVSNWLGNRGQGWLDAGIAHWFEDKVTGKCANFCFEEVLLQPGAGFKGGSWRTPVRKMVETGGCTSFAELSRRNTDQLSFEEHALSFAYIDFLLTAHGGAKLRDLLRLVKNKTEGRDALRQVYGLNPMTLEEAFKAWVKENYSLR